MSHASRRPRPMMALVWLVIVTALPAARAAGAAQPSRAEAELVAAEVLRFDSQIRNDVVALELGLADELVYTHSSARVQNKEEYLRGVESGTTRYEGIEVPDRVARVWDNTGLTHGTITLSVGGGRKLVSRYTGVYVRRSGRWQLVAWHTTSVPEAR